MAKNCLALNITHEPLRPISLDRAIRLVLLGRADVLESEGEVKFGNGTIPKPVVIRLKRFVRVPKRHRKSVTNTFLFARDAYTCQYCGKHERELSGRNWLTRDHILPLSRGGSNTWENCTTACSRCNHSKANRTPAEAGLVLRSAPTEPQLVHLAWVVRKLTPVQRKYIAQYYGQEVVTELERL